jgi:transposase
MKKVQYFIGIDLHKTVLQVCVLNKAGEIDEEFRQRLDETEAETEVLQRLRRWKANGQYVVEAQGLNRWFVNACQAVGMRILVANPTTLNLKRSGKKTDRRDAYELARRLWLGDIETHARTYYPADEEDGKRKVLRVRHKCVALRQQVINQLRGLLGAYRIPAPQTVLYTTPSLAKLERVLCADISDCAQSAPTGDYPADPADHAVRRGSTRRYAPGAVTECRTADRTDLGGGAWGPHPLWQC